MYFEVQKYEPPHAKRSDIIRSNFRWILGNIWYGMRGLAYVSELFSERLLDPAQFDELLQNAVDAVFLAIDNGSLGPKDGRIRFEAAFNPLTQELALTISDNGCGIEYETLLHWFQTGNSDLRSTKRGKNRDMFLGALGIGMKKLLSDIVGFTPEDRAGTYMYKNIPNRVVIRSCTAEASQRDGNGAWELALAYHGLAEEAGEQFYMRNPSSSTLRKAQHPPGTTISVVFRIGDLIRSLEMRQAFEAGVIRAAA